MEDMRAAPQLTATLPMYDWPELRGQTDMFWRDFTSRLDPELAAKTTFQRPDNDDAVERCWRSPDLLLGQTCWGPLYSGLSKHVRVLAQPRYDDVPGGQGVFYRSAIIGCAAHKMEPPTTGRAALDPTMFNGKRLAFNAKTSMSGYLALEDDLASDFDLGLDLFAHQHHTGSHRASIRAVATGQADIAAIDCRSWAIALAHEPAARDVQVVGWTAHRLGLPYICSQTLDPALMGDVRGALGAMGAVAMKDPISPAP